MCLRVDVVQLSTTPILTSRSSLLQAEERKITAAREAAEHARREEEARKAAAAAAEIRRKAEEEKRQAEETARKEAEEKQKALKLKMEQLQQQQQKLAEASVSENVLKKEKEYKDFIQKCKNDLKNDPRLNADRSTIKQHFTLRLNQLTNKKDHIMTTVCYEGIIIHIHLSSNVLNNCIPSRQTSFLPSLLEPACLQSSITTDLTCWPRLLSYVERLQIRNICLMGIFRVEVAKKKKC